jgi:uncharacterized membrane protein
MTLPIIELPKVILPFEIPVLIHPAITHFIIAIPVVILLLELINLSSKKRALSMFSLFLMLLVVISSAIAYLTGLTDTNHAYNLLSEHAKEEVNEHKLLGIYLMLSSALLLFFKLLSLFKNSLLKAIYILTLMAFVAGVFYQGKEGGELVYEYGINVATTKIKKEEKKEIKVTTKKETPKQIEKKEIKEVSIKAPEVKKSTITITSENAPIVEKKPTKVDADGMPIEDEKPTIATH